MESLCSCSPFVRGFLPGILIGLFSSVLLFNTIWKEPPLTTERQISWWSSSRLPLHHNPSMQLSDHREAELIPIARKLRASDNEDDCNPSVYLRTQYLDQSSYLLVVLVHSTPRASGTRGAIRASWLTNRRSQTRYLARFVIGTKNLTPKDAQALACENKQYGDLVMLPDDADTVNPQEWSSTSKLLGSFRWAMDNVKFSYILKCTDSTFAVIDTIVKELEFREQKNNKTTDFLWGFFAGGVQAGKEGRLNEKNWFLCSHFLPFPQGGGYVISHSLVELLLSLAEEVQHYEHDDIGLGAWISPFNNIEKYHDVRFNTGYYSRGCQNVYIVSHMETGSSMQRKYSSLVQTGQVCQQEFMSRLSYVYNWTAPANRCCVRTPNIP